MGHLFAQNDEAVGEHLPMNVARLAEGAFLDCGFHLCCLFDSHTPTEVAGEIYASYFQLLGSECPKQSCSSKNLCKISERTFRCMDSPSPNALLGLDFQELSKIAQE